MNKFLSSTKEGWGKCFYFQKSLRGKIHPGSPDRVINLSDTRAQISLYSRCELGEKYGRDSLVPDRVSD